MDEATLSPDAADTTSSESEMQELSTHPTHTPFDGSEPLPFPFNQRNFCRYESIEQRIGAVRVLVVNNLLHDEGDLSDVARSELGARAGARLSRERDISSMAVDNILSNVRRLVREPELQVAHLSEAVAAAREYRPQAIVLSGTLSDFDYYNPAVIERFGEFIRQTKTPVLGICGGHQLVGLGFGARVVTLDNREQHDRRNERQFEYQYRFIRITDPDDPIFDGIHDSESGVWQDYTTEARFLRVWQNHGLQVDRVPEGFRLLADSYLCKIQMMVKRNDGQLIYTVQFHLEKSFQDINNDHAVRVNPNLTPREKRRKLREQASFRTRWEHQNESRDGRIIFENFLREALKHNGQDA